MFYADRIIALDLQSLKTTSFQTEIATACEILHDLVDLSPENVRLQLCVSATKVTGFTLYRKYVCRCYVLFPSLCYLELLIFAHCSLPNTAIVNISA